MGRHNRLCTCSALSVIIFMFEMLLTGTIHFEETVEFQKYFWSELIVMLM